MKPALSVVEMIPDVHRTPALAALRKAAHEGRAGNLRLTPDDKDLAFFDGQVALTSPIGARLLMALYQQGRIKLKKPAAKKLPTLAAYIETETAFRAAVRRLLDEDDARRDRLAAIIADPTCATPDEITPQLIDKVATAQLGHGVMGQVTIAGLTAHRGFGAPTDDDARTLQDSRVICWWIGADGQRQGDRD
ncbi:hypothetical protein [Paracoccus sp. R86501]|uniref:hypothetical protein n=1 Tax=Paracoccus sp. R86501 TaxID=3101711 RepID=UPI00366F3E69